MNTLDMAVLNGRIESDGSITVMEQTIEQCTGKKMLLYDRNGVTALMQELHYGEGYQYAHDTSAKLTDMQCLPEGLKDRNYYEPTSQGREAEVKRRLEEIKAFVKKKH